MRQFLILFFSFFGFLAASSLKAQTPVPLTISDKIFTPNNASSPDGVCFAGTIQQLGPHTGQSNDVMGDPIFLCRGDSIRIDHAGNGTFMDPNPATQPGIGYIFYSGQPLATGPLPSDIQSDPNILNTPPAANGVYVATGQPNGDHVFVNTGILQTFFNMGQPIQIWFAPATLDDFTNQSWESGSSCVNVNVAEAFSVVYLNAITASGIQTSVNGQSCIGRFQVKGGWPEFSSSQRYTIDISLASNPNVKAIIHTPAQLLEHGNVVNFSVPQSGTYNVTIEDGKSCGHTFQVNMTACNPADNVQLTIGNVNTPPGTNVCAPITVANMSNILGSNFNLSWPPNLLTFTGIQNVNPLWDDFNQLSNVNQNFAANGYLGIGYYDNAFNPYTIPDGAVLMEVCFDVLGNLGQCAPVTAGNQPAQVNIEDANGTTLGLTIVSGNICIGNDPIVITATPNNSCNTPGSITIQVSGGVPPYSITYAQQGGGTVGTGSIGAAGGIFTAANLPAGTYDLSVVDGAQTIGTAVVTLEVNTIGASLSEVQPSCAGICDGQYTAMVSFNGFNVPVPGPEYTFQWAGSATTTQTITGLCAAVSYSVTVTNTAQNCSAVASATLSQPAPVDEASVQTTNASCTGLANGLLSLAAQGGTPFPGGAYQFTWAYTPSVSISPVPDPTLNATTNPQTLTLRPSGFYHVTVTDSKGCTYTSIYEIEANKELDLQQVSSQVPGCFGGSDGALTLQMNTNPQQPNSVIFWDFSPQPSGSNATPGQLTYALTGLAAGDYTVTAVDAEGCTVIEIFQLGQPAALGLTLGATVNPTCAQPNTGSIQVNTPTGGSAPFNFAWSSGQVTQNISNVPAGTYTVTVTDNEGCTDVETATLTLPPPPAILGVDSVAVKCGADGCLTVIASPTLSYAWTNVETGALVGTTPQVCNLAGGNYGYCVTDANQCRACDTIPLGGVEGLDIVDTSFQLPQCFNFTDGRVQIVMDGGTLPYNFQWSNGTTSQVLLNIGAGNYTVTVTDANLCQIVEVLTLPNPPDITYSFAGVQAATCANTCDGNVIVVAGYATVPPSTGNFFFRWEDNAAITDSIRTNLCGGTTNVTITDTNNCAKTDAVTIAAPPPVVADANSGATDAKCDGGSDGTAFVTGTGGNGAPYNYDWGTFGTGQTIVGLDSGLYVVTIFDSQGCTGTFSANVSDPEPLSIDTSGISTIACNGGEDGSISVVVIGGNPGAIQYVWTNGLDTVGNSANISDLPPGQYFLTVTDSEGCTGEVGPIVLNNPPPVEGSFLQWDELICNGDQTTLYIDTIFGGNGGPYSFSLDYGVTLDKDFPISMGGGPHVITYYDRIGCISEDSINVFEPDPILVAFNPATIEIELGDSIELRPLITGAAVDSFIWAPIVGLSDPTILRPYAVNYETETFKLTVFDANGCMGMGQIRVEVDPNRNVYIPNVFHPGNSSGLNDRFNPLVGTGVLQVNYMRIYDRWGALMYERDNFFPNNNDFSEGWDGTYRGDRCNPGVYVYIIEVEFLDGRVLLYRGDVTVLR
ncbi:MAG: gliding motility-associated C-terminal domain-containing protein [Saprospiraceae bacterium]